MQPSDRVRTAVFLLATLTLWTAPALSAPPAEDPSRVRAVQVLVIEEKDIPSIRSRLRLYRRAGFDTVIVRSFHLPGDRPHLPAGPVPSGAQGVYFPTERAPVIQDIISPFAAVCREEGMKVYAWMVTRKARFGNPSIPRDVLFDPEDRTLRTNSDLDILNAAVEPYLQGLFMDLAATGVDGILLQDDLASRMTEGFSVTNLDRYRKETGETSLPYRHLRSVRGEDGRRYLRADRRFQPWIGWKTKRILALARKLEESATAANRDIKVAINLTYETITDPENGRLWLAHDLKSALRDGPTYTAVMLYHRQIQEELGLGLPGVLALLERSLAAAEGHLEHRTRIILKFQTQDWRTGQPVPPGELMNALTSLWDRGWSIAFVPPPTPEQLPGIRQVLGGF
ncbi:MAG: hypothetical protein JSV26_09500 [bacterium]|nr:MAG: hypothetical protein JSV26_09500 [bacterium]